jgi:hypothetical protein
VALVHLLLEREEFLPLGLADGLELVQQIIEECQDSLAVFGHLDVQNVVGKRVKPEKVGDLAAQLDHLVEDRHVLDRLALVAEDGTSTCLGEVGVLAIVSFTCSSTKLTRWG